MYEQLGIGDLDWSAKLGSVAMELLQLVIATAREPLVVEANFRRLDVTRAVVQVYCTDTADALNERYRARDRHPGHLDHDRVVDPDEYAPLPLDGPLIRYRIGDDILEDVRACVR